MELRFGGSLSKIEDHKTTKDVHGARSSDKRSVYMSRGSIARQGVRPRNVGRSEQATAICSPVFARETANRLCTD